MHVYVTGELNCNPTVGIILASAARLYRHVGRFHFMVTEEDETVRSLEWAA